MAATSARLAIVVMLPQLAGGMSTAGRPDALTVLGGSLARVAAQRPPPASWTRLSRAWVLPPVSTPWAAIHFVGGAGFGSAPQLCYDELLSNVAQRCGVCVVATPYDVSLDHWALSAAVHSDFEHALAECQTAFGLAPDAPVYRLGHSLGAKLQVLGALAAEDPAGATEDGAGTYLGMLGFNNFGIEESAALASNFLASVQGGERGAETAKSVLDAFSIAQQLAAVAGAQLEVSPSPQELEEAVEQRWAATTSSVWRFDGDQLDSSAALLASLPPSASVELHELDGGHLLPVCFRLDPSELDPALALLLGASLGGGGISLGQPSALIPLCDSVCDWIWPRAMTKAAPALTAAAATNPSPPQARRDSESTD